MAGLADTHPFVISQDLIWRDMDAYQHVNNAVYFRYFEDVRMAFFESAGASRSSRTAPRSARSWPRRAAISAPRSSSPTASRSAPPSRTCSRSASP